MNSKKTRGWNSYLDWAALRAGAYNASAPELWEPVFVRSNDAQISTTDFFVTVDARSDYAYDPFEQAYNDEYRVNGAPVEAFLLRKHKKTRPSNAFETSIEVLHVGALSPRSDVVRPPMSPSSHSNPVPAAIGIIDDGIAYLHPRFQKGLGQTRFAGAFLQTLLALTNSGLELSGADINGDLARLASSSEDEIYRTRNAGLYDPLTRHGMRQTATHGTLMLDLAAGADPLASEDAAMRDVPLLMVQLPPEAFEDTSGVRMQTHILQGLRWMIHRAFASGLSDELVVNISLGITASAKNGKSFLSQQIKREIERVASHYNGSKTLELVFAYGNAYDDGLIARAALPAASSASVSVALQPDDHTPSFVELRLTDQSAETKPKRIEVTLTAPDGTSATRTLRKGRHVTFFGTPKAPIARLYHTAAREIWEGEKDPAFLTLAFAPTTSRKTDEALAASGLWTISCRNVSSAAMDLTLQVQRDDSPFGRNTGARQAYFDDAHARAWNQELHDFSGLAPTSALTNEGSNSAFSTVSHDNVHTVGAAIVRHHEVTPARYTAQGADWSGNVPDASAIAETSRATAGVLAAGTFATGAVRLSGTSAAAASFTRHLVQPAQTAQVSDDFDRLGTMTVLTNPSIKGERTRL